MNYNQSASYFFNHYHKLSEKKKEDFSRLCNKLLSVNYICGKKPSDQQDYFLLQEQFSTFESYFNLMDYVLEHHHVDKVINLYNKQDYNRYRLKKNESILILILRKMYFRKMQEVSLSDQISISLGELFEELEVTGIYEKRINKTELRNILVLFRRYNLVDMLDKLNDDYSRIIIYPTILYALPIETIEAIDLKLKDYLGKEDDFVEEISEDEAD